MASGPGAKLTKGQQRRHQKNKGYYEARRNSLIEYRHRANNILRHLQRHPWDQSAHAKLVEIAKYTLGKFKIEVPALVESPRQARAKGGLTLTALRKERARLAA